MFVLKINFGKHFPKFSKWEKKLMGAGAEPPMSSAGPWPAPTFLIFNRYMY
jgi:hypothetical protein